MLHWIRNNWRLGDSPTQSKILVKRTDIVWDQHQDKVFKEIAKMLKVPTATKDTPGWFQCRMKAIGRVTSQMTENELKAVDALKQELSENGYPEDERPK